MKTFYKRVRYIGLIGFMASSLLISGCRKGSLFKKSLSLSEKVTDMICEVFPERPFSSEYKGPLFLGEDKSGEKVYAVVSAEKGSLSKLTIRPYKIKDKELEKQVCEHLSIRNYDLATEKLEKNGQKQIAFLNFDPLHDSLEDRDIILIYPENWVEEDIDAKEIPAKTLRRLNEVYMSLVNRSLVALREESVAMKKRIDKMYEEAKAIRAKREKNLPNLIKSLEKTTDEFEL